jgi:spore maturation protein CgeB
MFESTGRGGFTIYPRIKGLENLFTDKEIVLYEHGNLKDLEEKINYYLEHDEERESIRMAGNKRTKSDHTYVNRWKKILETLDIK